MTRKAYLKHKVLIEAWANGADIEVYTKDKWWAYLSEPGWYEDMEYRIKPKQTITEWLAENNSDYMPNWEDTDEEKYFIFKNCIAKEFDSNWNINTDWSSNWKAYGTVYMPRDTARKLANLLNKGEVIED